MPALKNIVNVMNIVRIFLPASFLFESGNAHIVVMTMFIAVPTTAMNTVFP